jgi:hypothetical protein
MYRLVAFPEVSARFADCFGCDISPYFDRIGSNSSGRLEFVAHKFVRHLMRNKGYAGSPGESLESFVCRRYGPRAWNFLRRLM